MVELVPLHPEVVGSNPERLNSKIGVLICLGSLGNPMTNSQGAKVSTGDCRIEQIYNNE